MSAEIEKTSTETIPKFEESPLYKFIVGLLCKDCIFTDSQSLTIIPKYAFINDVT